jgi:hypothetical protein
MKQRRVPWIAALWVVVVLLGVSTAGAQVSPGHDLRWHVVAAGGQKVASANHVVQSTVGQLAIGPVASTHTLGSGYWYGISRAVAPPTFGVYLPVVLRSYTP